MYNGFTSKKMEFDYRIIVNRMMILLIDQLSLQLQLNQIINKSFFEKQFYKLLNQIKDLENHKNTPPKFSNMLIPLNQVILNTQLPFQAPISFASPILEQDAGFTTNFSKSSFRSKSLMQQAKNLHQSSPNKSVHRICRSQKKQTKIQLMTDNFIDFQNESLITGKKTPYSAQKGTIFYSPVSLEAQQQ